MNEHSFQIHNLPAVYVLETQMPQEMIDDVNNYMDEYREYKNKKSLAKTLVGQIHKGEQLLLDHNDKSLLNIIVLSATLVLSILIILLGQVIIFSLTNE